MIADRVTAWQVYYYNKQAQRTEVRGCWCHSCWNEAKEGLVQLDGSTVPKKDLDKRKNDEEVLVTAQPWSRLLDLTLGASFYGTTLACNLPDEVSSATQHPTVG